MHRSAAMIQARAGGPRGGPGSRRARGGLVQPRARPRGRGRVGAPPRPVPLGKARRPPSGRARWPRGRRVRGRGRAGEGPVPDGQSGRPERPRDPDAGRGRPVPWESDRVRNRRGAGGAKTLVYCRDVGRPSERRPDGWGHWAAGEPTAVSGRRKESPARRGSSTSPGRGLSRAGRPARTRPARRRSMRPSGRPGARRPAGSAGAQARSDQDHCAPASSRRRTPRPLR